MPDKVLVRTGDKVIMVGDSITQVYVFYQALASSVAGAFIGGQAPAPVFENAGLNGARVCTFNDPAVRASNLAPHCNETGVMVIELGINDEYQSPATPDWKFRSDYRSLLTYVFATFPNLRGVILMTPWIIGDAPHGVGPKDRALDRKAAIVADLACEFGCVLVDVRSRWFDSSNLPEPAWTSPLADAPSGVHPNGVGAVWLCEQLRGAFEVRY